MELLKLSGFDRSTGAVFGVKAKKAGDPQCLKEQLGKGVGASAKLKDLALSYYQRDENLFFRFIANNDLKKFASATGVPAKVLREYRGLCVDYQAVWIATTIKNGFMDADQWALRLAERASVRLLTEAWQQFLEGLGLGVSPSDASKQKWTALDVARHIVAAILRRSVEVLYARVSALRCELNCGTSH